MRLPASVVKGLLRDGSVRLADEPDAEIDAAGDLDQMPDTSTVTVEAPARSATKAAWVDYACKYRGARMVEARRLTKEELIAQYGPAAGDTPDDQDDDGDELDDDQDDADDDLSADVDAAAAGTED